MASTCSGASRCLQADPAKEERARMVRGSPATELLTVPEPSVTRAVRAMPTTPLASGSKKRAAGVVLLRAQEQAGACRRTLQKKSAQSAEVERREPLTNGAGLTRHGAAD